MSTSAREVLAMLTLTGMPDMESQLVEGTDCTEDVDVCCPCRERAAASSRERARARARTSLAH